MLHDMTTNGIDAATQRHFHLKNAANPQQRGRFIYRLEGYINFVGQVRGKNDTLYKRLKESFDAFFNNDTSHFKLK